MCTVPNLVGAQTTSVPGKWAAALFTGPVTYSPSVPPKYTVAWQSLTAGSTVLCTSGITVAQVMPTPSP
jgi:hypothetical protein